MSGTDSYDDPGVVAGMLRSATAAPIDADTDREVVVEVRLLLAAARLLDAPSPVWPLCQAFGPTLDTGPNRWIARPSCILPKGHGGRHFSEGRSGGGWEVRWSGEQA